MLYYFLILPLFALGVLAQAAVLGMSLFMGPLARLRPYLWRVLVWSSAGFVLANAVFLLLCVIPSVLRVKPGSYEDNPVLYVMAMVGGIGMMIGPPFASAIGFGLGMWIGIRRARRSLAATVDLSVQP